jgi:YidC/Oxa1 family membrane protein insertase
MILAGFLGPIEELLTNLLEWLHASVGLSWGFAIIALTLIVRMAIVPLTVRQIHSMQKLQVVAPELKALQQKYKNDKKRQQEEIMRFYRENKVNPASSCLPMLLQIPVFIALFFVLRDFERDVFPKYPGSELGFLEIVPSIAADINSHWSGYLLLVLYVGSQVLSTLLMAATMDKTQRAIFIALPFLFIPFILTFPTGLLLYWVTTNLWTIGQGIVTRRMIPKPEPPPKRSSRTPSKQEPEAGGDGDGNGARPERPAPKPGAPGQRPVRRRKKRGPQARR